MMTGTRDDFGASYLERVDAFEALAATAPAGLAVVQGPTT